MSGSKPPALQSAPSVPPVPSAPSAPSTSTSTKDENVKSRLYGYEVPPLEAGDYIIITKQSVEAPNELTQQIVSKQPVTVRASQPYALSPDLIHSYYPPNMRKVSATTLPHVVLKGATPWERSKGNSPGQAPTPWLALLLFTDDELCVPPEVASPLIRPSGTKALTLPLTLFNACRAKFCHTKDLSVDGGLQKPDGSPATGDFIFPKSAAFRMFFDRQDLTNKTGEQRGPDLDRYKLLTLMTDTGVDDGTGHRNAKLSTLMGHRTRPYGLASGSQKVHAHVVSIESLESQIDYEAAKGASATVALVSLMSWTFTWQENNADQSLEMFKNLSLQDSLRPLEIKMSSPKGTFDPSDPSLDWVQGRLREGYTIVRHRDIAGETAMALYRGPLMPRLARRARIQPSIHGSDLQIIDSYAKVIDVSYSTAWELGRSLASRDAKFSSAISSLRRKLYMRAVMQSVTDEVEGDFKITQKSTEVVGQVLGKLDKLFNGSQLPNPSDLPLGFEKPNANSALRWTVPKPNVSSLAAAPGVMTQAKLRRHLQKSVEKWLRDETRKLFKPAPATSTFWQLSAVFDWLVNNLMSLKIVPATYLFPDPAVIASESINCFLVDDVWVDALVDGAMSIANTMGGGDDPVRDEIRTAFNVYLKEAPTRLVPIGGSGFVIRSGIVESFPDLEISITANNPTSTPLECAYRAKNDDMILCLVARGQEQKLVDYVVKLKLPPHQQRFAMEDIYQFKMDFTCTLKPFLKTDKPGGSQDTELDRTISWTRTKEGKVQSGSPSYPPIWDWNTGVLAPHLIAQMTDDFINADKEKTRTWDKPATDSRSIYLATQLTDRDHCVTLKFDVTKDDKGVSRASDTRELFPKNVPVESDTREKAALHDPRLIDNVGTPSSRGKSWFTKQAFSQDSPGNNIPAQSNTTQHIVFSIKPTEDKAHPLPSGIEVTSMEFTIPLGEDASHLLDHLAPLPTVRAIGARQQWVTALTHRKSDAFIVVHLMPRGGRGAVLQKGLDASFLLTGATVNGVMGDDVKITVTETYAKKVPVAGRRNPEVHKIKVKDSWFLVKE